MDQEQGPRRLAGADLDLKRPTSIAARWDVAHLVSRQGCEHRAAAAALGLCWPRLGRRIRYSGDALEYGGKVIDLLLGEGATFREVSEAGAEALGLVLQDLPGVERAETFTETRGGGAPTGSN